MPGPRVHTCPAGQDVPEYMHHTARGELREALDVPIVAGGYGVAPLKQALIVDGEIRQDLAVELTAGILQPGDELAVGGAV